VGGIVPVIPSGYDHDKRKVGSMKNYALTTLVVTFLSTPAIAANYYLDLQHGCVEHSCSIQQSLDKARADVGLVNIVEDNTVRFRAGTHIGLRRSSAATRS
jgi:hypothetical protein